MAVEVKVEKKTIIAVGSVPKAGGTFTFYRTLRPKLMEYGIDIRCVSVGRHEALLWEEGFADEGCTLLARHTENRKRQAQAFVAWCRDNRVDIVAAINSEAMMSAIPHLPEKVRVMSRLASTLDSGYKNTLVGLERLMRIVTTAPGHSKKLMKDYCVNKGRICMIPNGVDPERYDGAARRERGQTPELKLGFLGRIEHVAKGVLFVPDILLRIDRLGVEYRMRIAGKGALEKRLKRDLQKNSLSDRVDFLGNLTPQQVPGFLADVDVLLFTSQSEGCPNALLEAMMAGCVPVTSHLAGITDYIIKEGRTGFLCPVGECETFAERVCEVAQNRRRLSRMSLAVARDARERFSQARMALDYASLFKKIMAEPVPKWAPRPWSRFQVTPHTKKTWRKYIPYTMKLGVRGLMFDLGLSKQF